MDDEQQGFDWRTPLKISLVADIIMGGIGYLIWPWLIHAKPETIGLFIRFGPWILGYIGTQMACIELDGG